jgi:hypothetical protein
MTHSAALYLRSQALLETPIARRLLRLGSPMLRVALLQLSIARPLLGAPDRALAYALDDAVIEVRGIPSRWPYAAALRADERNWGPAP